MIDKQKINFLRQNKVIHDIKIKSNIDNINNIKELENYSYILKLEIVLCRYYEINRYLLLYMNMLKKKINVENCLLLITELYDKKSLHLIALSLCNYMLNKNYIDYNIINYKIVLSYDMKLYDDVLIRSIYELIKIYPNCIKYYEILSNIYIYYRKYKNALDIISIAEKTNYYEDDLFKLKQKIQCLLITEDF
jgi:hypothetical protein